MLRLLTTPFCSGQSDKFGSYTIMEHELEKVLNIQLVQVSSSCNCSLLVISQILQCLEKALITSITANLYTTILHWQCVWYYLLNEKKNTSTCSLFLSHIYHMVLFCQSNEVGRWVNMEKEGLKQSLFPGFQLCTTGLHCETDNHKYRNICRSEICNYDVWHVKSMHNIHYLHTLPY